MDAVRQRAYDSEMEQSGKIAEAAAMYQRWNVGWTHWIYISQKRWYEEAVALCATSLGPDNEWTRKAKADVARTDAG